MTSISQKKQTIVFVFHDTGALLIWQRIVAHLMLPLLNELRIGYPRMGEIKGDSNRLIETSEFKTLYD